MLVESPAKARTISQFLNDFKVYASYGHIRDLPQKSLGINIEKNFEPKYQIIKGKEKIIRLLKKVTKEKEVYLATDFDREGEAIAWHLKEVLNLKNPKRITFHEVTKEAIEASLKNPKKISQSLVEAQKARRIIDRLFGYKLSPFLWRKIIRGLSAGRVQSCALRLIVEREEEIRDFKPKDYFKVRALFEKGKEKFYAYLYQIDKKVLPKTYFEKEETVQKIKKELEKKLFKIIKIIVKDKVVAPPPPYITATLQQDAFIRLNFSAKKTMFLAQQLYEGVDIEGKPKALITYMRTDSPNLAKKAQDKIREFIKEKMGEEFVPEKPKVYKARSSAQEAHEAIRPVDFSFTPEKAKKYLPGDLAKLYSLIFWRTLASQMKEAIFKETEVILEVKNANTYIFKARGVKEKFLGFLKVYPIYSKEVLIPLLKKDERLEPSAVEVLKFRTKPKPRFTEATLIKILEKLGIGRPSTYAPIISLLYQRNYMAKKRGYLHPTEIGEKVVKFLKEHFPDLIDFNFTARMEKELDEIAEGKIKWLVPVKEFYYPLSKLLEEKDRVIKKEKIVGIEYLDRKCPICKKRLITRLGRYGRFISCENFPICKYKEPLNNDLEKELDAQTKDKIEKLKKRYPKCVKCGGELKLRKSKYGYFLGCENYPRCHFIAPLVKLNKSGKLSK